MSTLIDIKFNFLAETGGRDPDRYSLTLRKYHKILWSKQLPNGKNFELSDSQKDHHLYHKL